MAEPLTYTEILFHEYRDKVYGFFVDFLQNREISRDLTQDIFVKLIQKEDTIKDIADLDGYIYQMCRNLAFDHLKKAAHSDSYRAFLLRNKVKYTNFVQQRIDADHYGYILQQSLSKLPEQQKLIFTLSKKEGLSNKKIAKQLGLSTHTVRNHLYQAMKNLRTNILHSDAELTLLLMMYWWIV